MQIRLIATDLDGTLVPAGGSTPERVLLTLEEAMHRGILVVPATGRTLTSIPPEISGLSGIRYIISSNGAAITDRKERRRIHETLIPAPAAAEILRRLSVYGVYSCAYIHDTVYNWSELPSFLSNYYKNLEHFHKNGKKDPPSYIEENGLDVEKLFVAVGDPDTRNMIRQEFGDLPGLHLTSSSSYNLEFNRCDADKGKALRWLCDYLEIPMHQVLAMGDNENDHTMLQTAGITIAPENASDETKLLVSQVVAACREGGTADFIRKWILDV